MSLSCRLMDVKRFAVHDGPGIRTTLFLKGCPLHCIWCHNPEGISLAAQVAYYEHKCLNCGSCVQICSANAHVMQEGMHHFRRDICIGCGLCEQVCIGEALKVYGTEKSLEEVIYMALEDREFYGSDGGVTLSGGEPLLQPRFAEAFLTAMKERNIHTAIDTCGCVPWANFVRVLPHTDLFLFDIKHSDPDKHRQLTGVSNEQILDNLERLSAAKARIEIRIPLVPGCNDDSETLQNIGLFLRRLNIRSVKLLPYHALARSKYRALAMPEAMPNVPSPSVEKMKNAAEILKEISCKMIVF